MTGFKLQMLTCWEGFKLKLDSRLRGNDKLGMLCENDKSGIAFGENCGCGYNKLGLAQAFYLGLKPIFD